MSTGSSSEGLPWEPRSVTARFGATANPLADARGSDRSPDREGGVAPNSTTSHGHSTSRMKNRAYCSLGLWLGSVFLGLFAGAGGADLYAAGDAAAPVCTSCHEQGQKLAKSAHAALTCDTCHESHEKVPHPANIPKPACIACHADQAGDYDKSVHGQARKGGNEGAPDCSLCHGGAHELLAPKSQAFRGAVPDTCGMCHTEVVDQFRSSVHGT